MSIPKLKVPIHEVTLPSGQAIKYRPYVLGEQKILLMAAESQDSKEILNAIKTVVGVCVQSPKSFSVEKLSGFDLEYFLMQLRAKSVGEFIELTLRCPDCTSKTDVNINIEEDIKIKTSKDHKKKINIGGGIGVVMNYPTLGLSRKGVGKMSEMSVIDADIFLVKSTIKSIYDKDSVHQITKKDNEELDEFINSLSTTQYEKIINFFKTAPTVICSKEWKCSNCKKMHTLELSGLEDFFI